MSCFPTLLAYRYTDIEDRLVVIKAEREREGQDRHRGLRGMNTYVYNKYATRIYSTAQEI